MKVWFTSGLLALFALTAMPATSRADGWGLFGSLQGPFSCGTFCVCHFGKMHQHGPLYNYGPYYGYPPFEPYGPWGADLRYNGNCNNCNTGGNWGNWFHRDRGCNTCGWSDYAKHTWKNVFHRTHPCGNKVGCSSCGN